MTSKRSFVITAAFILNSLTSASQRWRQNKPKQSPRLLSRNRGLRFCKGIGWGLSSQPQMRPRFIVAGAVPVLGQQNVHLDNAVDFILLNLFNITVDLREIVSVQTFQLSLYQFACNH